MEDLEKQIKEQGRLYSLGEENSTRISEAFEDGVTSDVSKEYWQQGMYSEEEVLNLLILAEHEAKIAYSYLDRVSIKKWFEQNKKK